MTTQAPRDPAKPETSTTTARSPRQSSLATLKNYKDFRLVWAGNFIALGGQWIQMFSIGWLVLLLTDGNAILTGTVIAIRALPILVIGPWAGVLADRMDRRKVVMASQTVMAVSACSFAFLVLAMHQRLRMYPLPQQCLVVFLILGTNQMLVHFLKQMVGADSPGFVYLWPAATSAIAWPAVTAVLDRLNRKLG